jgi:hypothetical protein
MVELLIKLKSNVNKINGWGDTAIYRALVMNHIDVVKLLIRHKADVNLSSTHKFFNSPFLRSVFNNHLEVAEMLFFSGAKIDDLKTWMGLHVKLVRFVQSLMLTREKMLSEGVHALSVFKYISNLPRSQLSSVEPILQIIDNYQLMK